MKGHLRPHGDRVRVWYDLGPDPVTGKRRQRTKVLADEETAMVFLEKVDRDLSLGVLSDPNHGKTRVADFVNTYLTARVDLEVSTLASYESKLRVHVLPVLGHQRMGNIRPDLLSAFYRRLLEDGVNPATIDGVHRVLRGMFSHAVKWKYLADNPAAGAETPKVAKRVFDTWTAVELARFLPVALKHRWGIGYLVSAATGMRRGEVCGLRWENVDLDHGLIHVRSTRLEVAGNVIDKATPKSSSSWRTIPIDETVVALLRAELLRQRKDRMRLGLADSGLVVVNPDGSGIRPNSFTAAFRLRLLPKAGLPYVRLHDLRHTWGTLASDGGVDPKTVSKMLGHGSVGFTLNTYVHGTDQAQRDAAELMGRHVTRDVTRPNVESR